MARYTLQASSFRSVKGAVECNEIRQSEAGVVGEVERDGDVCNFEPHEAVEIWQSPALRLKKSSEFSKIPTNSNQEQLF